MSLPAKKTRAYAEIMKWFRELNEWLKFFLMFFVTLVLLYLIGWGLGSYFETLDNIKCGLDKIMGITCNYKYQP